MNADTKVNLLPCFFLRVVCTKLGLNLLGALASVDHRGKVYQKGVTNSLDDRALLSAGGLLDDLIMHGQQAQRASLVRAHLTTETDDVGEHDRRKAALFGVGRVASVILHG